MTPALSKDQLACYADPTWFPEPGRYLHLDSEYSNHYCLFILNNGQIEDSRIKNWRHVQWEKLDQIVVRIKGHELVVNKHPRDHKFFLFFRQVGWKNNVNGEKEQIRLWTVGATDGVRAFLYDVDFHYGTLKSAYDTTLESCNGHIHPRIRVLNSIYSGFLKGV